MQAFIAVLDGMVEDKESITRAEWQAYEPTEGSYSVQQEGMILGILETVLKEEDPTEGLVEVVDEFDAQGV